MTNVTIASSLPPGTTRTGRFVMVLLLASACLGHAQLAAQTIEGVLLESGTDRPIELGLITLLTVDSDSVGSALTDEAGRFRVESPSGGEFLLSASALGYRPTVASSVFTIEDGGAMSLQFRIEPLAMQLEGITVEAEASLFMQPKLVQNGFVERAQRGFGRFITPRDIELAHALTTGDLLARTGRVTTRPAFGGDQVLMLGASGYCSPSVYLDGFRISLDIPLEAVAPVSVLEAAEVYRSATEAPAQYGGGMGGCGVIVLWTKAR